MILRRIKDGVLEVVINVGWNLIAGPLMLFIIVVVGFNLISVRSMARIVLKILILIAARNCIIGPLTLMSKVRFRNSLEMLPNSVKQQNKRKPSLVCACLFCLWFSSKSVSARQWGIPRFQITYIEDLSCHYIDDHRC